MWDFCGLEDHTPHDFEFFAAHFVSVLPRKEDRGNDTVNDFEDGMNDMGCLCIRWVVGVVHRDSIPKVGFVTAEFHVNSSLGSIGVWTTWGSNDVTDLGDGYLVVLVGKTKV